MILRLAWRDLRASGRSLWVFCACLALGVALIAATGGLFRLVNGSLLADTRTLFGGDVEVFSRSPLTAPELAWMREHGVVSRLVELRTMMQAGERVQLVELQSFDERYPLYGEVVLRPAASLADALALRDGAWGVAIDPTLARRLGLSTGARVRIGELTAVVRAVIERQPDRSLRADWRGPPVLMAQAALDATGLVQPQSRIAYRYRVRTNEDPVQWRTAFAAAFPDADWEARTFAERSERLAEVLGQIASGLLLIGFSALFIGGLGVFNSVHAYLQGRLATIATLRALGLRDLRLAGLYLAQVLMLAGGASLAGALIGGALAFAGAAVAASSVPVTPTLGLLLRPLALAWTFGVLTALTFALPALGRALSVTPAALFRGLDGIITRTPAVYWQLTAVAGALTTALALAAMPDPRFGLGFVLVTTLLLVLLEGVVHALRAAARALAGQATLARHYTVRLALANLYQPGSPLRASLLSLGSALTLLVASTLVVAALLRTVNETIPDEAPALVFYDIPADGVEALRDMVGQAPTLTRLDLAPLVLGRIGAVNGEALRASGESARALAARDEHKLSYRLGNFDNVVVERGAWWPDDYSGPPLVAMEDREADQLGLEVGDRLRFDIMGSPVEARLAAIYGQRRLQARFWLEAIFSDGALDPHITRYVGAAYLGGRDAEATHDRVAGTMPGIITVRTENILDEARTLLARAAAGLAVIAAVTLLASLLVLASVLAGSRTRKLYDASILHTLGVRVAVIRTSLQIEYGLLALLTSCLAIALGSAIAGALLHYRLGLAPTGIWWTGVATAFVISAASLGLGARHLLRQLRLSPAFLLRASG